MSHMIWRRPLGKSVQTTWSSIRKKFLNHIGLSATSDVYDRPVKESRVEQKSIPIEIEAFGELLAQWAITASLTSKHKSPPLTESWTLYFATIMSIRWAQSVQTFSGVFVMQSLASDAASCRSTKLAFLAQIAVILLFCGMVSGSQLKQSAKRKKNDFIDFIRRNQFQFVVCPLTWAPSSVPYIFAAYEMGAQNFEMVLFGHFLATKAIFIFWRFITHILELFVGLELFRIKNNTFHAENIRNSFHHGASFKFYVFFGEFLHCGDTHAVAATQIIGRLNVKTNAQN